MNIENEDTLQKGMYELQNLSNNYNFKISTTKMKVMAFKESTQFNQKIILNNKSITEQVPTLIT
jgi:hypothetical protein